jgi:Na+-driven multidrug efflux pump
LIFIPKSIFGIELIGMGAKGAALATVISSIITYIIIRYLSSRLIKTKINRRIFKHLTAAGISGCLLYLIQSFLFVPSHFYEVIGLSLFGGFIYLIILILMRELNKKDAILIIEAFNIFKMFSYIVREIKGSKK